MTEKIIDVSDNNFESEVLNSDKPVLVDFWAPWCGPCKAIAPLLEELSSDYDGQVKFARCNVDDNPVTPGNYGIRAIPTLIVFKDGRQVDQIVGMADKSKLEASIKKGL